MDPMYPYTFATSLADIPGVGPVLLKVFKKAGLCVVRDVVERPHDEVVQRLRDACAELSDETDLDAVYWTNVSARCKMVVVRCRDFDASPGDPGVCTCPLTLDWLEDPVVTPEGHTYSRHAIEEAIRRNGRDPLTRTPLTADDLVPNRLAADCVAFLQRYSRRIAFS
jgi:hypothetical protein